MVMPPGAEEGEMEVPPLFPGGEVSFYNEEDYPPIGSTQIFGAMPADEMPPRLTTPFPSAEGAFEYGHTEEMDLGASGSPGVHENKAHEVAYLDFGANYSNEDPLGNQFMRELEKAASVFPEELLAQTPPAFSAPQQALASSLPTPVRAEQEQPAAAVVAPSLFESTESTPQSFAADLSASAVDEAPRVEDEEAAQLHHFPQAIDFLEPAQKTRRWMLFWVVLAVLILTVLIGAWLGLDYSPEKVWFKIWRYISSILS